MKNHECALAKEMLELVWRGSNQTYEDDNLKKTIKFSIIYDVGLHVR